MPRLRLGTRASPLARWQANWVAAQLQARGVDVELVPITTRGDSVHQAIGELGATGLFTKELQRALVDRQIDLAVHSLKDLPTDANDALVIAAVPAREEVRDAIVSRDRKLLDDLPLGAVIGTGSLRRRAQLLHRRSDLRMADIRGNVDTRLKKLADGQYDAVVLACAGLRRLGLESHIAQVLDPHVMLPAVGQGALAIEARGEDAATRAVVEPLDDRASHASVTAERALLAAVGGGCLAPIGAWARVVESGQLLLDAVVLSADGRERLAASGGADLANALRLGQEVASGLVAQGARQLIARCRG